ncbi:MAG: YbbR-like domain-containing protein [Prevotella sp.]|nr:YbbR-like domain-containing protein [Prevotella sp.]
MDEPKRGIFQTIRDFLFRLLNKEFLIFLFFLALSGVFWLAMTLNETMEKEISIPLVVTNVPKDVMITSNINDTLRVTVRDKGYTIGSYVYGNSIQPVKVNFANYARSGGHGVVTTADLLKLVRSQLGKSTSVVSIKPEKLDIYYNYGNKETRPVVLNGRITAGGNYFISEQKVSPEQVTVYASDEVLKNIKSVMTAPVNDLRNLTQDPEKRVVKLEPVAGAKFDPGEVTLEVKVDVYQNDSIDVPVTVVNAPEGRSIVVVPSVVKVHYVRPSKAKAKFRASDFRVEADYGEMGTPSSKCRLTVKAVNPAVKSPKLEVEEVNCIIKQ